MNRTLKFYGIFFLVVVLLLAVLEMNKKEITNWRKNFDPAQKSPFGLYIFNQEAGHLFKNKLRRTELSPFSYYSKDSIQKPHNMLVIQQDFDEPSWRKVLHQVYQGSDAMVFAESSISYLEDTLKFNYSMEDGEAHPVLRLTDAKFTADKLFLDKFPGARSYSYISKETEILGTAVNENKYEYVNFIKIKFGKGSVFIHSEPLVLTNYYLLKPGKEAYLQDVLSYLPNRETVWFTDKKELASPSPMSFILSQPALRYAWWLFLAGLLLFAVFNAKRKQRVVPIIKPLENKSAEFVKSIGNLYLQEGDFHDMMNKKSQYFLSRVRMELLLDTRQLNEDFARKLQVKTGKPQDKIDAALALIKKAQDPYAAVIREDLIKLNRLLDDILN